MPTIFITNGWHLVFCGYEESIIIDYDIYRRERENMSQEIITQPYTEYDLEILCAKKAQHTMNSDLADALSCTFETQPLRE